LERAVLEGAPVAPNDGSAQAVVGRHFNKKQLSSNANLAKTR
jgi:hypothetical protein